MGFAAQVQSGQTGRSSGKGGPIQSAIQTMPEQQQQTVTMPGQGGQPRVGMPNQYSNTVGQWDNASIQPVRYSGKGKGF